MKRMFCRRTIWPCESLMQKARSKENPKTCFLNAVTDWPRRGALPLMDTRWGRYGTCMDGDGKQDFCSRCRATMFGSHGLACLDIHDAL
jgi:hypothetical protein